MASVAAMLVVLAACGGTSVPAVELPVDPHRDDSFLIRPSAVPGLGPRGGRVARM
jgi:hypothetical protein